VRFVELQDLSVPLPLEFCYVESEANSAINRFVGHLR
jgi:hypothetical protein